MSSDGSAPSANKYRDYCAAFVIATEAGATFRRLDGRGYGDDPARTPEQAAAEVTAGGAGGMRPFDVYSMSCVCACSPVLADEVAEALRTPAVRV